MYAFWKRFFWGPPSRKRVAWVGGGAGLIVVALPVIIATLGTGGQPVFLLALAFVGLAETGWVVELLPRHAVGLDGWGRAARWLCAVIGLGLTSVSLLTGAAQVWFAGIMAIGALLLVLEMAPSGFANHV